MRRINLKFAAILFLVLLLTTAGAWGLYVVQSGRIAQSLLWQARKNREAGENESAIKLANQYLQFRPDDAAVMTELAEWMRERAGGRKQLAGVANLYEKALRVQADNDAVRRKTADAYLTLGQYGEAFDHLERLLQSQPNNAELLTQAGWCLQAAGKYDAAANNYRRAIQADARYVNAYVYAAGLQQGQYKKIEAAGEYLAQAVAANPDSPEARAALAGHLRRQRKLEEAANQVKEGLVRNPDNPTLLLTASEIASAAGDLRQSRALLDRGCTAHPTDTRFVCALSWQLLYDGRADLAVQKLRAGKAVNPNDIDILTLLGDVLAQDGQIGPLEEALRELQDAKAPPEKIQPRVQYLESRLLMRRGRFAEARQKLNGLRPIAQRTASLYRQVNILLAQCCDQLGDRAGELDSFKRLLEQDPNAGAMRLEYARALARVDRHADALREFVAVVPRPEVSSRIVASVARSLIKSARSNEAAWTDLQRGIESLTLDDGNANPTVARAELDRSRNRPDAVLSQLVRNIGKQPRNATLHVERALLFELKFGPDRALVALNEGEQYVGEHADFRSTRARLLSDRLDRAQSDALAALAQTVEQFSADDRQRILREVIAGFRLFDDPASVERMLRRLAQVRPDDFACREALHSIAFRNRDIIRRAAMAAEIEALEGKDGPCLQRLEAQRLIWNGSPAELQHAEARLAKVAENRPADPAIPFLRGRIAEIAGRSDAAREQYRLAFDRGYFDSPTEELLLDVPGASGHAPSAILRDEIAARMTMDTPRAIIVTALPLFDSAARARLAEQLVAQCPADHAAHQAWLGRLFNRMGLPQQSEAAFRRAAACAPQSREGWLALLTERMGDSARLDATIAEVRQALPPLEAHLLIGRAFESARRYGDAKRAFEDAAALKPDEPRALRALAALGIQTGRRADACAALEALTKLSETDHAEDVRWARRTLALQLAFTPSLAEFERALTLLDQNKVGDGWPVDDLRARALVLATQKGRPLGDGATTARRQAIDLLELLQQKSTARSAEDLLLLAKLYRAENDETKLRQTRERMQAEFSGHYGCTAYLAREALRERDLAACEKRLPTLHKFGPTLFETRAIEFQFRTLSGDADSARRLLTEYIAAVSPAEQSARKLQIANFLCDFLLICPLSDRPAAAADLRSLAIQQFSAAPEGDPEILQRHAVLLAQNGQIGQAFELLQKRRGTLPPEAIAAAQVLVLRTGAANEQQRKTTELFLLDELEKRPASIGLQISLADYCQFAGQRDKAIAAYRRVLEREPNNVVALNNLAWALAADPPKAPEALALIQRAIDLAGPMDDLLDTRARIRFESGDAQAGLRDLIEAASEVPTAARLLDLAAMHRKAGQLDLADRVLQKARRFAPGAEVSAPR
jgi:tetratricopeptide (TPR) repeat protein